MNMTRFDMAVKSIQACLYASGGDGFSDDEAQLLANVYHGLAKSLTGFEVEELNARLKQMSENGEIDRNDLLKLGQYL